MIQIVKHVVRTAAKTVLGYKNYTKLFFLKQHGYRVNLKVPTTFSEKIQWIKFHGDIEKLSKYVDKYEVREFVKGRIGEEHLIPLLGVYENADDIDVSSLPNSFVAKATHGMGWNLIVKDKMSLDWVSEKTKINKWIRSSFYKMTGERNYKLIKGRVVVEKLIEDPTGDLKDFKIFCFHGEPKYIQVDGDRFGDHKRDMYDINWKKIDVQYQHPNFSVPVAKPEALDELLDKARKLSKGFDFVRVDLYYTGNHIYFGELTFTPSNGFDRFSRKDVDVEFGKHLSLSH